MVTKRKPYTPPMTSGWWRKLGFYRFYMLREGTSIPTVWFSLVLIYGLFSLKNGPESWAGFVGFLQNPVVIILNIITLAAAVLHTKTWFELAPKASIVIIKNQKMPPQPVIAGLWVLTVLVTLVVLFVAFFW